ncbi:glycosyltransferase [Clostridium sp. SHJSY1]|uniref:glycosyltransferase n=1 Tax=Clostridium sp. SHJSY1 TaxID=2942483 RepID=UPI002875D84C|nr:glycosyltransferase [Clostridium sp. SHJSY1]MDS0526534.1 glycosyltransferase [Clostridium sp. SHJSY1]
MKKIVFVCDSLRIGGIQRSLVNLMNAIDTEKYSVDLFLFFNGGEYKKFLNSNIKVITGTKLLGLAGMTNNMVKKKCSLYILRKLLSIFCLIFGSKVVFKFIFLFEKNLKGYDIAISYSNNVNNRSLYFGYNLFVLNKVIAKRKIAWIHADYAAVGLNNKYNNGEYEKFHTIINVSKTTKDSFDMVVPKCKKKSEYIYNIIPNEEISFLSKEYNPYNTGDRLFRIVSVCRLDANKSGKQLVITGEKLKKAGANFKWYIVGDGPERASLEKYIDTNNLRDNIKVIGNVDNPYPYISGANLFVSASKSECFPLSIAESLVLNTPVVATHYPALHELIKDNVNGFIVGKGEQDLFERIFDLIINRELYEKVKKDSRLIDVSNIRTLEKLYKIIEINQEENID